MILLPLYFKLHGVEMIREKITEKLKQERYEYKGKCGECGSDKVIFENTVIDKDNLKIKISCDSCMQGKTKEYIVPVRIG
jgi:transcription elongation factor Elf1